MERPKSSKANQNPLFEKGSSVEDLSALEIPVVWEDGRWKEKSQGKDDEADHRSKGQKFKRSKERETDHSPVINTICNTSKKVRYHSTSSQEDGFAENSPVNNPISSAEKRPITREVHRDSVSNNKDYVDNENESALGLLVPSSSTNNATLNTLTEIAELLKSAKELEKMMPCFDCNVLPSDAEIPKETLIYGLVLGFIKFVKRVEDSWVNASDEKFDRWFKELDYVEALGFSVEEFRGHLTKLREMHDGSMN